MRPSRLLFALLPAISLALLGQDGNSFQNGTSGVLALEAIIVSPTLAIFFDFAGTGDPLTINGHPAWGAIWNLETNQATALDVFSDTFCASGGLLSNGTMVSNSLHLCSSMLVATSFPVPHRPATDSWESEFRAMRERRWGQGARFSTTLTWSTCLKPAGTVVFAYIRWVVLRVFPFQRRRRSTAFSILERTVPSNLFPRVLALPDGKVFMVANNQSIIYDIEAKTETILPDIPNGVRVTNPMDGSATLLPLSPPLYFPEVLVCGGSNSSDQIPPANLSTQDPASDQCSRITLTPAGIKKGWEVERMLEGRMMPEMILLPNGQVLIINGGQTGYAAMSSVGDLVGNSNADHAALTPSLYDPSAPLGHRISNKGLPTNTIARMYHSSVSLTPSGKPLARRLEPKSQCEHNSQIPDNGPTMAGVPTQIAFDSKFTVSVSIPKRVAALSTIQVALMDLGFSSHAFHSSSRLVWLEATLSRDRKSLEITSPPNNRVYPPGPGYIFLTVGDTTSVGAHVMVGNGDSPPVADQGRKI
ncbi:glyoxal oxidase precursor [Mycena olivaceomarginata]|nr:glyoxal oxidase precursor [Mycena olivaceomarginata]